MPVESTTTMESVNRVTRQAQEDRVRTHALSVGRFSLHMLEMLLAMMAGMPIYAVLRKLVPASSGYAAAFKSGTIQYDLAMTVFMTVPMVAWMVLRHHGWRHSAEMAFGMFGPVAVIVILRLLGADGYLPWLSSASHSAMFLGMLAVMLYRRDHYTARAGHSAHATHMAMR